MQMQEKTDIRREEREEGTKNEKRKDGRNKGRKQECRKKGKREEGRERSTTTRKLPHHRKAPHSHHLPLILGMYICSVLQKVLHYGDTIVARRKVEWRGVAAIKVPHIDKVRLGSEDATHTIYVPRLGCLEKLLFSVHAGSWWVFCEGKVTVR